MNRDGSEISPFTIQLFKLVRVLVVLSFVCALWAFAMTTEKVLRGTPDMYPNQNINLIVGTLGTMFLTSSMWFTTATQLSSKQRKRRFSIGIALLVISVALMCFSLWLTLAII